MKPEAGRPSAVVSYSFTCLKGEAWFYPLLESTNLTCRQMASAGVPEGRVVVADEQTGGRGRLGRSWYSPAGAGFYGSLLLRPADTRLLTQLAGVAVAESLIEYGVPEIELKWPNDVLAAGRKVSGVLVETSWVADRLDWVVVGIGVNLKQRAVPTELTYPATSLEAVGVQISAEDLCWSLLKSLDRWYEASSDDVLRCWTQLAPMAQGQRVQVCSGEEIFEGITRGITPEGFLKVDREGQRVEVSAGEVSVRL